MRFKQPTESIVVDGVGVKLSRFIIGAIQGSVEQLLNLECNGEYPYYRDRDGWDAFFYAVNEGRIDMVRFLFSRYNFDINAKDRYGRTVLMIAAARDDIRMIDTLIELGADLNAVDYDGWKPFHYAVRCCRTNAASHFINRYGINPDTPDSYGVTGLMIASDNGDKEMVKTLLKNGARPDVTDRKGKSVIHYLSLSDSSYSYMYNKQLPLRRINLDAGYCVAALFSLATKEPMDFDIDWTERKIELLRKFVKEHNLDINKKDNEGNTPLIDSLVSHDFPVEGTPLIVQALIHLGANPLIRNNEGVSALDIARIKRIPFNWGGMTFQSDFHYKFQL